MLTRSPTSAPMSPLTLRESEMDELDMDLSELTIEDYRKSDQGVKRLAVFKKRVSFPKSQQEQETC
jgi:hypothetical protein